MSSTSTNPRVAELLAANTSYAKSFTASPAIVQMRQRQQRPVFVLTCMDPRVVPEHFLGPAPRAAVYRNGGGRFDRDVVRSITVLQSLASNKTGPISVMVIHHTDCGLGHVSNEKIRADILSRDPKEQDPMSEFGCWDEKDLEKSVLEDVEALQAESLLKDVEVTGYILDSETGLLREI